MIGRIRAVLASQRPGGLLRAVLRRILRPRTRTFRRFSHLFAHGSGLEIGGPSAMFSRGSPFPVYPLISSLDNCNFSNRTLWEGALVEGRTFRYDRNRPLGTQYVAEATDLRDVSDERYEFVLSSHSIEHTANPLRALAEWKRVLKPGGHLLLVVPHRDGTFDHRRPVTLLKHLVEDFAAGMEENDLTHLPEILALHDLSRDPPAGDRTTFETRCRSNFENRGMHHHVFDTRLVAGMLQYAGFDVIAIEPVAPYHIFALARKPRPAESPARRSLEQVSISARSPFPTDREPTSEE